MQPARGLSEERSPDVMDYGSGALVRTDSELGLSGEDKWAWRFLWKRSNCGRQLVKVKAGDVGADQGTGEKAGRTRIENLAGKGLLDIRDRRQGVFTIEVLDPASVIEARVVGGDPQPELFHDDDTATSESPVIGSGNAPAVLRVVAPGGTATAEPPAVPPSEPPPRLSEPLELSEPSVQERNSFSNHQPSVRPSELSRERSSAKELAHGGTDGGTAAEEAELAELHRQVHAKRQEQRLTTDTGDRLSANYVAALAASLVKNVPDPRQRARDRERWIDVIRSRVNDPNLKTCVIVKVAAAVSEDQIKSDDVATILANLDQHRKKGTLRGPPGKYFLFAARKLFADRGLEWKRPSRA